MTEEVTKQAKIAARTKSSLASKVANKARRVNMVRKVIELKVGNSVLHLVAQRGQFNHVPAELITVENLTLRNTRNVTPLHYLAESGNLCQIPSDRLTEDLLLTHDDILWTVLHAAIAFGHAAQIPKTCWTEKTLTCRGEGEEIFRLLMDRNQSDCLLGVEIPEDLKRHFDKEWLDKNEVIRNELAELRNENAESGDIEIF